jgi:multiple sugar transport system ATP-binding protein
LVARTEPHREFKVGDMISFIPRMDKARFFDRETELSLLADLDAAAR